MVIGMQDSEVHVPRHLSAKERARLEAEAAEEAARARANAGNDMTARALKQMMNGNPNGSIGVVSQAKMAQPAWMNADPSAFTTEQQQEVSIAHPASDAARKLGTPWMVIPSPISHDAGHDRTRRLIGDFCVLQISKVQIPASSPLV